MLLPLTLPLPCTWSSQLRALLRTEARPFEFLNMGLLSYVGGSKAIAQVTHTPTLTLTYNTLILTLTPTHSHSHSIHSHLHSYASTITHQYSRTHTRQYTRILTHSIHSYTLAHTQHCQIAYRCMSVKYLNQILSQIPTQIFLRAHSVWLSGCL